ncbi:hypothetical protein RclHR1_04840014 [Rhizophagus clarus]|uniref:HTH myb-type domain-containing protein n=1 Tax=Rhizophagus clarus TaxID=94130 RepID=A0A2Z6RL01_9GLOM|nr:hypothetical protein RclHR1_04840014 [Rhizophagus clarus]
MENHKNVDGIGPKVKGKPKKRFNIINKIDKNIREDEKKIIRDYMKEWEEKGRVPKNPFVELAKKLKNRFNAKSICDYWWNILDPRLDRSTYSKEEKDYICELGVEYLRNSNGPISWKDLQPKLETKFEQLRLTKMKKVNLKLKLKIKMNLKIKMTKMKSEDEKDKNEFEGKNEEIVSEVNGKIENEIEGITEEMGKLASPVDKNVSSAKNEKFTFNTF